MELSSDNLFAFVLRRYKQKENKNSREQSPKFQNVIKPKKEEKKLKNIEIINYFNGLIINNSNISNVLYNSIDPFINECFNKLEYLSITNNYIRNLDFILHLPNLFFLDLFGNPLDEFAALNIKNSFGYLRLSVESFNEKKILNIFDLKCGILDIDLKDKNTMRSFNINNHHICMINNEINYLIDKIKLEEYRLKTYKKKRKKTRNITRKSDISMISSYSNSMDYSDIRKKESSINLLIKNLSVNKEDIPEKPVAKIEIKIKNDFLLKMNKFYEDFQNHINKHLQNEVKFDIKSKKNFLVSQNNEIFSSQNLVKNKKYLNHEKDKLILLFEIYKKISIFNTDKNNNKYYVGNIYNKNVNNHIDNIFVKEIKDNIMNHSQIPRTSIIILISIIFYTIGTISEKMMSALINYILTKYYGYDENQKFPDFSNLGDIHYLAFYYSTYDYIYNRMIYNEKNINIDKYKDILETLQMETLILKSNIVYKKLKINKEKDNKIELSEYKKIKINNEIKFIKELEITKDFLILIEFLCDYIIYEKIEDILINNSYQGEYSYLIELKETLEETEFQNKNKNYLSSSSLSALKFQKNKKERIFNKFYFEKDEIKQIKNKDFKNYVLNDFNKSRTVNNFSIAMGNSVLFNSTNSNFNNINNEENEYNKNDDIDVDEFFYIDNKNKNNSSNKLYGKNKNYNISLYKLKERENDYLYDNSFEGENNSSIKLPNLYQNQIQQPYEEFEFLKKMIFDPDFLSQHARNVIKFEKQKKKIQKRYQDLYKDNKKNIKKNDKSGSKNEEPKPIENSGSPCFTNYDHNSSKNNIKTNLNIEYNSKDNSKNKYKMILSSNNPNVLKNKNSTPIYFKSYNKLNLNTIINNEKDKKIIEGNNKTSTIFFDRKCNRNKHQYKTPFNEVPESFPGITLLQFGIKKKKKYLKKIEIFKKKSPKNNKVKEENKKETYKQQVMNKIKQTIKDNILRNARRVAFPMYPIYS